MKNQKGILMLFVAIMIVALATIVLGIIFYYRYTQRPKNETTSGEIYSNKDAGGNKVLPICEFPEKIGDYGSTSMGTPIINQKTNSKFTGVGYVLISGGSDNITIQVEVFETGKDAQQEFINTNFYNSSDCKVISGPPSGSPYISDCFVISGKSANDRACTISGVEGRCVSINNDIVYSGSWTIGFEWLENKKITRIILSSYKKLERAEKFKILEPFVDNFKGCTL